MISICQYCGKEFHTKPARVKAGKGKFCSLNCYHADIKSRRQNKKRFCLQCGKEFYASQAQIDSNTGKFCSQKCNGLSRIGATKPIPDRKLIEKNCEVCGKSYFIPLSDERRGHGHFCSKSCAGKIRTGEKSTTWKGGISFEPYCPKFNNEFKERVRAFFGYRCVECGSPQNGVKLPIHHVNFNKNACCDGTLPLFVPLCPSCHSKTNHNRPYWQEHFTQIINETFGGKCYLPKAGAE